MRRADRELLDKEQIESILKRAKILHLGMFGDQFPYVVPMHYGFSFQSGEILFYVHSAPEGRKLDIIRKSPKVCVEVDCDMSIVSGGDNPCKYGALFSSVICEGEASILDDIAEKKRGLDLLMLNQTGREFEISEEATEKVAVIRITCNQFTAKAR